MQYSIAHYLMYFKQSPCFKPFNTKIDDIVKPKNVLEALTKQKKGKTSLPKLDGECGQI